MNNELIEGRAVKAASFNGIDIYRVDTDKFKTSSIHIFFLDNLTRENVTKNALLPAVMRRGCKLYPASREIDVQMENLHGAVFDCGVTKKGESHIIHFYTEFLSHRYTPGGEDLFEAAFNTLWSIINEPVFDNGTFREDYVNQEKEKLKMLIESRINDKMEYSLDRCLEETCRDEPFAIYDYGISGDIPAITSPDLLIHYKEMMRSYPIKIFLSGSIGDGYIDTVVKCLSKMPDRMPKALNTGFIEAKDTGIKEVTERLSVSQGKLCLGFRTNIAPDSPDYQALMVYNGVLGGGIQSKLFQKVREKEGLAYYVFSRLEKYKGLMVISSGIDFMNKDKALDIILKQLKELKDGAVSEYELEAAIKNMETGIKSLADSQVSIVDFWLGQIISGTEESFYSIIKKIKSVTVNDIMRVAAGIVFDTVYFLTAKTEEQIAQS